jgi:hypothetical protein
LGGFAILPYYADTINYLERNMWTIIRAVAAAAFLTSTASAAETYRLIHAIGNEESEAARDLSKTECEAMKADRIAVAEALGIHSEKLGIGSITCLPESIFED